MPSKKKKYNARFPPARIKKIMQMDEEVGKVAATVPVIISRALELFIESLLKQATQMTVSKNAKTLSASHLKHTIESQERYNFLRELVANVPDHQVEEEGAGCSTNCNNGEESGPSVSASTSSITGGKRPRGRPKKIKDGNTGIQKVGRKRRKESSESESENSEETDEADEGSDEESLPTGSAGISAPVTTTAIPAPSSPSASATTTAEVQPAAITTTTLTNPPPISELLAQSEENQTPEVQQQQQQQQQEQQQEDQQQQLQDGSAPVTLASTFQAPTMMPAAMPMYQSMPGAAPPHLFTWPANTGILAGGGFPSLAASPQGTAFAGLQPQGAAFPGMMLPGIGFPGIPTPLMGFHGLPGTGFTGVSPLGAGIPGMNVVGAGLSGMPSKAPAMAGAPSGAQGDDDYDT